MTQPATNAQVALQCAMQVVIAVSEDLVIGDLDVIGYADGLLRWLNANTSPAADQPGELA